MFVEFTVPGEPQGKGRPRFARIGSGIRTYTPEKTAAYENLVKLEYERVFRGQKFSDDAQIYMNILCIYSIPSSATKKKRAMMLSGEMKPTKKPDCDNVLKTIADSLNGIAYRDDAQIVRATVSKKYGELPGVRVLIEEARARRFKYLNLFHWRSVVLGRGR